MRSSPWQASPEVAERAVGPTDFRILGPVGVTVGGRPLVIGGARNRAVLAALLLSAGRVVSIDQLVEATWGPNPPAGARSQIQNRISKLRSALEPVPVPATGGLIRTVGGGYVIRPGADELDQDRFTALTALADRLLATGDPAGAAQALGRALDLRSGPALDGLGTPYLSSAAHGIEERLLVAFERLMQLHLLLRRHAEVIGELRCMTDAHPIREQLHALLMLALFRDGRLAEALDVYRTVRAALVDQFGLEPGATLQALNDAMLRSDPRLLTADLDGVLAITTAARTPPPHPAPHTAPPVPRELPAAAPLFGGRAEQLRRLDELAARPGGATGARCEHTAATAATVVITGAPGTGKTALAVHWGHRVGGEFPDGQLHLDLRGYGPEPPLPPLGALTALLRSLGAVGYDPDDVTAAATRYRSMMAERRILVLLDNAASAEQVQPLLPGGPGNQVIVTSRDRLTGLVAMNGARRLTLGALDPSAAEGLLISLIGEARAHAERNAVRALTEACACLPMALSIAATSLMDHPHRRVDELVRDLCAHSGLRNVAAAGPGWAALERSYDLSYMTLPAPARRLFQLIGAVGEPEISAESAAALAGVAPASARELLDVLSAGHLIEERAENRFGLNGLLRRYAVDRCDAESSEAERDAARQRLLRHASGTETAPNPSSWPSMANRWRDQKESMAAQAIMRRTTVLSR